MSAVIRCRSPPFRLFLPSQPDENGGNNAVRNANEDFLKISHKSWPKQPLLNGVFSERNRENPFLTRKEGDDLKLPWNQEESVRHIFDSYCKKILRQKNTDMQRSEARRRSRECSLSELSPESLAQLRYEDVHPMVFEVCGYRIPVNDDRLAAALDKLLREKRDVILLSYFMDMSDREIGELLDMARRTVQHRRSDTLAELRKRMEDDDE